MCGHQRPVEQTPPMVCRKAHRGMGSVEFVEESDEKLAEIISEARPIALCLPDRVPEVVLRRFQTRAYTSRQNQF